MNATARSGYNRKLQHGEVSLTIAGKETCEVFIGSEEDGHNLASMAFYYEAGIKMGVYPSRTAQVYIGVSETLRTRMLV